MKNEKEQQNKIKEDKPTRAEFHENSTVQGGSDFGQGSAGLGKESNKQGRTENEGSSYENEQGWNNEALRFDDIKPEKKK